MLDILETLGFDFDSLDTGGSLNLQQKLFPGSEPQSLCSYAVHKKWKLVVWLLGRAHCTRSYDRYNSNTGLTGHVASQYEVSHG